MLDTIKYYQIIRQDDNGNKFIYLNHVFTWEKALRTVEKLNTSGHKQVYYIEEILDSGNDL